MLYQRIPVTASKTKIFKIKQKDANWQIKTKPTRPWFLISRRWYIEMLCLSIKFFQKDKVSTSRVSNWSLITKHWLIMILSKAQQSIWEMKVIWFHPGLGNLWHIQGQFLFGGDFSINIKKSSDFWWASNTLKTTLKSYMTTMKAKLKDLHHSWFLFILSNNWSSQFSFTDILEKWYHLIA